MPNETEPSTTSVADAAVQDAIPGNTVPAEVVDDDNEPAAATPTRYALLDKAITRDQLRELRIRVFTEAPVPVPDCTTPSKLWLIGESGLRKLRDAKYTTEAPEAIDNMPNTMYVHLSNPDGSQAIAGVDPRTVRIVKVSGWSAAATSLNSWFVEQVKQTLSQVVDVPIHVTSTDGRTVASLNADASYFQLVLGASPLAGWGPDATATRQTEVLTPPEVLWGLAGTNRDRVQLAVWAAGSPLSTPEGVEIGAIDSRNMYVYFKLAGTDSDDTRAILRRILDLAVVIYKDPTAADISEAIARANYARVCTARVAVEKQNAQNTVTSATERVNKLQADIVAAVRLYNESVAITERVTEDASKLTEFLSKEFDLLKANTKVTKLSWRGTALVVETVMLYASAPTGLNGAECEYEIGAFTITICAARGAISFYNRTRRIQGMQAGMQAPHVYADGHACLGTANETIPRLIASYQWATAVAIAIEFLESANIADPAGRHVINWPFSQRQLAIHAAHAAGGSGS